MPAQMLPLAAIAPVLAAIAWTPNPIAFQLGPVPVYWYGVAYAVGLAIAYITITREARRRGLDARYVDNGIIIVAVAALVGGRLYHVIDQWALYKDDLLKIVVPPYTGLGVYGGILTGTIAAILVTRLWKQSFLQWADVIAPGLFVMQAVGRWGNFFNQELYGPPTNLPWAIAIDCAHRVAPYSCAAYPEATTFFHPLFLYESVSGILGALTLLWIARRWGARMRPGDLFFLFLIWYAVVRFALEVLRTGNWTFFGIPTAMLVSIVVVVGSLLALAIRHRPGAADAGRWGDPPARDEETYEVDDEETYEVDEDEAVDTVEVDGGDVELVDDTGDSDGGDGVARPATDA
ncbi:MAG TPA: prolipoprotein diacylglyceryl transferase [Candidatus Limnocylindrales bacterium]